MDYSSEVRQRFAAPARAGDISPDAEAVIVAGAAEDRSLGVWVRFQVQINDMRIEHVRFRAFACPHTLAAADRLAGMLEGRAVDALAELNLQVLAEELEIPREKFGKLLRLEDALLVCHAELQRTN